MSTRGARRGTDAAEPGATQAAADAGSPVVAVLLRAAGPAQAQARCLQALRDAAPGLAVAVSVVADDDGFRGQLATLAAASRAPFLLLLDARVELAAGSLARLLSAMEAHPECGAAGVKLVGDDGRIRQAGGVVWNDGSRCSYGLGEAADAPAYNYLREVDYCSVAALLLRREAVAGHALGDDGWNGLDYADAALGCVLRAGGWKVLYVPRAKAIDHGDAVRAGHAWSGARGAALGEAAFRARWGHVLRGGQHAPGQRMFRARERAGEDRLLLVVDHYLPDPERDAGARAILQTMQAAQALGWRVKFWPANQHYPGRQPHLLEEAGIEVIAGERWGGRVLRFLRYAGAEIDAVLLSRPEVARDTLDLVRELSRARVLFYGHDLHHRRMELQAAISGLPADQDAAAAMRALEESLWRRVDAVIYPSTEEAAVAAAVVGAARVHAVPLYAFDEVELAAGRAPADPARLLFVGGFGHSPNVDAAQWLVHAVLPLVRARLPGATLALVGSNPTPAVQALAGEPGVALAANVPAAELAQAYRRAGLAVVPLRFGAGVKLKVLEAMARGVPLVTTPVGAQGLPGVEACIRIAATAGELADAIVASVSDPAATEVRAAAARDYVRRHYGSRALGAALATALDAA